MNVCHYSTWRVSSRPNALKFEDCSSSVKELLYNNNNYNNNNNNNNNNTGQRHQNQSYQSENRQDSIKYQMWTML